MTARSQPGLFSSLQIRSSSAFLAGFVWRLQARPERVQDMRKMSRAGRRTGK